MPAEKSRKLLLHPRAWVLLAIGLGGSINPSAPVGAQTVRVRTIEAESRLPVVGAIVVLIDHTGRRIAQALTNETGRVAIAAPRSGTFSLRADRIGHPGITTAVFELVDTLSVTLVMPLAQTTLPDLTTTGMTSCNRRAGGERTAQLWEEIRKSLTATQVTADSETAVLAVRRFHRLRTLSLTIRRDSTTAQFATRGAAFTTASPQVLLGSGFVQDKGGRFEFFAPDAELLLSDEFLESHCFDVAEPDRRQPGRVGLTFHPTPDRTTADVRGTLWVDRTTAELRSLEFEYLNAPVGVQWKGIGGLIEFQRLSTGAWIVGSWYIRTADRVRVERAARDFRPVTDTVIGYVDVGGEAAPLGNGAALLVDGRGPLVANRTTATGELRGRVVAADGRGLSDAVVAIGGLDSSVSTDDDGRFRLTDLPEGLVVIRAAAIGFRPRTASFRISRDRQLIETTLSLEPTAQQLAPLEVSGRPTPFLAGKLEDFERRRAAGFGSFLTRAKLSEWADQPLSNVLRTLANVTLVPRQTACGGGYAAVTHRSQRLYPCLMGMACPFSVYVDGARVYDATPTEAAPNIDDYLTERVEAVEVYRGAGEAPIEFTGTGNLCGAIIVWTRIGGH